MENVEKMYFIDTVFYRRQLPETRSSAFKLPSAEAH